MYIFISDRRRAGKSPSEPSDLMKGESCLFLSLCVCVRVCARMWLMCVKRETINPISAASEDDAMRARERG